MAWDLGTGSSLREIGNFGFRGQGLGFRGLGLIGFRALGFGVQGFGLWVSGFRLRVWGWGFSGWVINIVYQSHVP